MPSMPVEVLPIAWDDVDQAMIYIAADDPPAADRLLESLMQAFQQIGEFPYSGVQIAVGGRRLRYYFRVYVHPYNIFYRIIDGRIVIMRVLHERMDIRRHLP